MPGVRDLIDIMELYGKNLFELISISGEIGVECIINNVTSHAPFNIDLIKVQISSEKTVFFNNFDNVNQNLIPW
ncbi:MAG TPA: hypothetical protein VMT42_06315 [candidate division Zixibacteria bacterium]|nr:hypothetical protein [candidate division Zixibacteria bacterium]